MDGSKNGKTRGVGPDISLSLPIPLCATMSRVYKFQIPISLPVVINVYLLRWMMTHYCINSMLAWFMTSKYQIICPSNISMSSLLWMANLATLSGVMSYVPLWVNQPLFSLFHPQSLYKVFSYSLSLHVKLYAYWKPRFHFPASNCLLNDKNHCLASTCSIKD